MRRTLMVLALLAVGVGCGDGGGSKNSNGSQQSDTLLGLLGSVPDTENYRSQPIYYYNLSRLRDGDDAGSFEDDVTLLTERSSGSMALPRVFSSGILSSEFRDFTGFDTREIDVFVDFGSPSNDDQTAVIIGDFDAGSLESGLRSSPGGEELETETIDGVTFLSLGIEGEIGGEISAIRNLGESIRIAVDGQMLYWSRGRAVVDACVAVRHDDGSSLADDVAYSSVAAALDAAEIVNAYLVTPRAGEDWTLAGVGESFDGETSTLTFALQYPDAAHAAAAVGALGTLLETGKSDNSEVQWSEFLTPTDIHSEGPLLIATIKSLQVGAAYGIVFREENLLQV